MRRIYIAVHAVVLAALLAVTALNYIKTPVAQMSAEAREAVVAVDAPSDIVRLAIIEAAIVELRQAIVDLRQAAKDMTTAHQSTLLLLVGNLVAVSVALIVYIVTGRQKQ